MSSGAQAQIAASQAASAASAEAAANALAFSKDIFNYQKGQRQPFISAGQSATTALMQLLGLGEGLVQGGGTGGTTLRGLASSGAASGLGGAASRTSTSTTTSPFAKFGPLQTFPSGIQGQTVGGSQTGNFLTPSYERQLFGSGSGEIPTKSGLDVTSGGQPTTDNSTFMVSVTDPDGNTKSVPASLASFYQARGFTVG